MDSNSNTSSKKTTVIVGVVVVFLIVVGIGFLMTKGKSSTPSTSTQETKGVNTQPEGTPEPTLEPVAPELNQYTEGRKEYAFDLSYPGAYGYAVIDPSSVSGEVKPVLALVFSDTITGEGETISLENEGFPAHDPTFMVYETKGTSLENWVLEYKKLKDKNGDPLKVLSERSISVSNQPAYEIVTATGDKEIPSYKKVMIVYGNKIYELSYYPNYKPGHAQAIWNTIRFGPSLE